MANGASAGQRGGCDRVCQGVALHNLSYSNTWNSVSLDWTLETATKEEITMKEDIQKLLMLLKKILLCKCITLG